MLKKQVVKPISTLPNHFCNLLKTLLNLMPDDNEMYCFMKMLFDLGMIALFFVVYKFYNMFYAVGSMMIAYTLQVALQWLFTRKIDKLQVGILASILILGGATLIFHDGLIFKWKPTIIYAIFSLVFFFNQFFGKQRIIQKLFQPALEKDNTLFIAQKTWNILNLCWGLFFLFLAALNLYIAYHYSDDIWVNFKLFGIMGLMLIFIVLQTIYLYISSNKEQKLDK